MCTLILMRHGESEWNRANRFTGWVDIPLSKKGIEEALQAGRLLKDIQIDVVFTTPLSRAFMTAMLLLSRHKEGKVPLILHEGEGKMEEWGRIYDQQAQMNTIPVMQRSALNERMYGKLQGLNKAETIRRYGAEQVKIWRRSYEGTPPDGESLKMTAARVLPCFNDEIMPLLREGHNVLVVAHGNSLRSIVMSLDGLSTEQVVDLEIPTGVPILYDCEASYCTKRDVDFPPLSET